MIQDEVEKRGVDILNADFDNADFTEHAKFMASCPLENAAELGHAMELKLKETRDRFIHDHDEAHRSLNATYRGVEEAY